MNSKVDVLDHGYVRLVDTLGDDLSVINAARVSYDKESKQFGPRDDKLLAFLAREKHTAPFRHAAVTLEVYAPLFVARQWWKYTVATTHIDDLNGWNESSRRYVTEVPTFYVPGPDEWRSKPANSKQGSGEPVDFELGLNLTDDLMYYIDLGEKMYNYAMSANVAPEQARLFLPAYGMYVRWRTTTSLQAVLHFLHERLEHDAQEEIRDFASAVHELVVEKFPRSFEAYGL